MGRAAEAYLNAVEQALSQRGQTQAELALQKGQIWGNFLTNIGQLANQGIQQTAAAYQDQQITNLFTNQWNAYQKSLTESTPFVGPIDPRTTEGAALAQMADLSPAANYTMPGAMGAPPPTLPTSVQHTFNNLFPRQYGGLDLGAGGSPPIPQPGLNQLSTAGLFASPSAQSIKFAAPPSPTETSAPPAPPSEPTPAPASTPPVSTAADQTPMPTRAQMEDPKHPYLWLMQFANTPEEKQAVLEADKSGGKSKLPDTVLTRVAAAYGGTYKPPTATASATQMPAAIPVSQSTPAPMVAPTTAPAPMPAPTPAPFAGSQPPMTPPTPAPLTPGSPTPMAAPTPGPYVSIPPPGSTAGGVTYRPPLPPFVPPTTMTGGAISPFPSFGQIIKVAGLQRGIAIINSIQALQKSMAGDPKDTLPVLQAFANGLNAFPEDMRPTVYALMRPAWLNTMTPQMRAAAEQILPQQYDDRVLQFLENSQKKPTEAKTDAELFQDYLHKQYGPNPSGPDYLKAQSEWETAKHKPTEGAKPGSVEYGIERYARDVLHKPVDQLTPDELKTATQVARAATEPASTAMDEEAQRIYSKIDQFNKGLGPPPTPQELSDVKGYEDRKRVVESASAEAAAARQASAQEQQNKIQQQEHDFRVQQAGRAEIKAAETDARKQVGTANLLREIVNSAKAGNDISGTLQSLMTTMAAVRAEGLNRINTVEIGATADAGSLEDRILGSFGKLVKGGANALDPKLQQDMLDFAGLLEKQANWSYRSAFSAAVDNYGLTNIKMRPELAGPEPWTPRGGTNIRKVP